MFRAIRRSFTEGVKGLMKNGLMSVTSLLVVTACIFVFGVFLMCIFNINHMTAKMAEDYQVDVYVSREVGINENEISLFLEREYNLDDAQYMEKVNSIETLVMGNPNVDISGLKFVTGRERIESFRKSLSEVELAEFYAPSDGVVEDSFVFTLEDETLKTETLSELSQILGVRDVMDAKGAYAYIASLGGVSKNMSSARYDEVKNYVKNRILEIENVDIDQVGFIDGIEKFKTFKEGLSPEELKDFEGLPEDLIPDAFTVKLLDLSIADQTIKELESIENVESVENSREFLAVVDNLKGIVQKVSIWIIVAFALVSPFIISNTIKLTVHNRRKEINIMKYVGATDSYIRGPFIVEGILIGLLSALCAFFISQWTYEGLMTAISKSSSAISANIGLLKFGAIWTNLLGAYLATGTLIGAFGSAISTRRYLNV